MFIDSHFLGTGIEWHRERGAKTADFAPAAKRLRAIDLSCRACGAGAGCWAWIPGRGTFGFHPQPPTMQDGYHGGRLPAVGSQEEGYQGGLLHQG